MVIFFTIFFVPCLIALAFFVLGGQKITLDRFALHLGAMAVVAGLSCAIIYHMDTHDTEVWNGRVASKEKDWVSCSHSYSCNCRQVCSSSSDGRGGSSTSCTTVCDTCYEHSHDYDWNVTTTNGETITIDRVDRQGVSEPPRWSRVRIGEPTTIAHSYTNYIKGAPDTLFRRQGLLEKYKDQIPTYPKGVYDYYRYNHLLDYGGGLSDAALWNLALSELNADLGKTKEVNVQILATSGKESEWALAIEQAWIGGKKNDATLVINMDNGRPTWSYVMAWSKNEMFKVVLRDKIMELHSFDRDVVINILRETVSSHYERRSMKDFEYLKASITPSPIQYAVAIGIGFLISLGLGVFFLNEVRDGSGGTLRRPRIRW